MTIDGVIAGRTIPAVTADTAPFFEAAARGELLLQRCVETGKYQYYPRPRSIETFGDIEWVRASGQGTVYSFTIVRQNAVDPVFSKLVPYVIAAIDLPEGVRMFGNITGCNPEDVRIGLGVKVYFAALDDEARVYMPFWKPA